MNKSLTLFILLAMALPTKAYSQFRSKDALIKTMVENFGSVIAIPGGNSSPYVEVNSISSDGYVETTSLNQFAKSMKSEIQRPELNYVSNNNKLLGQHKRLMGAQFARAYQVSDVLLCYKKSERDRNYTDCYIFPQDIDNVIDTLKAAKIIK